MSPTLAWARPSAIASGLDGARRGESGGYFLVDRRRLVHDPRRRPSSLRHRALISTQRYDGGNPLALRDVTDGSRNLGTLTRTTACRSRQPVARLRRRIRALRLPAFARLAQPARRADRGAGQGLRVSAAVSRRALAPGAEEFLPPGDAGIWLPPQRTFSLVPGGQPFQAERVRRTPRSASSAISARPR